MCQQPDGWMRGSSGLATPVLIGGGLHILNRNKPHPWGLLDSCSPFFLLHLFTSSKLMWFLYLTALPSEINVRFSFPGRI
jgi:hypothetical protein